MPAFFFHYNKPASQQAGEPRLTIHHRGSCILVSGIECRVPVKTRIRKTQPRCVMSGRCASIAISEDGYATIS